LKTITVPLLGSASGTGRLQGQAQVQAAHASLSPSLTGMVSSANGLSSTTVEVLKPKTWPDVQEITGINWEESDIHLFAGLTAHAQQRLSQRDLYDKSSIEGWTLLYKHSKEEIKEYYKGLILEKIDKGFSELELDHVVGFLEVLKDEGEENRELFSRIWKKTFNLISMRQTEVFSVDGIVSLFLTYVRMVDPDQKEKYWEEMLKRIRNSRMDGFDDSFVKEVINILISFKDKPYVLTERDLENELKKAYTERVKNLNSRKLMVSIFRYLHTKDIAREKILKRKIRDELNLLYRADGKFREIAVEIYGILIDKKKRVNLKKMKFGEMTAFFYDLIFKKLKDVQDVIENNQIGPKRYDNFFYFRRNLPKMIEIARELGDQEIIDIIKDRLPPVFYYYMHSPWLGCTSGHEEWLKLFTAVLSCMKSDPDKELSEYDKGVLTFYAKIKMEFSLQGYPDSRFFEFSFEDGKKAIFFKSKNEKESLFDGYETLCTVNTSYPFIVFEAGLTNRQEDFLKSLGHTFTAADDPVRRRDLFAKVERVESRRIGHGFYDLHGLSTVNNFRSEILRLKGAPFPENKDAIINILDKLYKKMFGNNISFFAGEYLNLVQLSADRFLCDLDSGKYSLEEMELGLEELRLFFYKKLAQIHHALNLLREGDVDEAKNFIYAALGKKIDLNREDLENLFFTWQKIFEETVSICWTMEAGLIAKIKDPRVREMRARHLFLEVIEKKQYPSAKWIIEIIKLWEKSFPDLEWLANSLLYYIVENVDASKLTDNLHSLIDCIHTNTSLGLSLGASLSYSSGDEIKDELIERLVQRLLKQTKTWGVLSEKTKDKVVSFMKLKKTLKILIVDGNYPKTRHTLLYLLDNVAKKDSVGAGLSLESLEKSRLVGIICDIFFEAEPHLLDSEVLTVLRGVRCDEEHQFNLDRIQFYSLIEKGESSEIKFKYLVKRRALELQMSKGELTDPKVFLSEFDQASNDLEKLIKKPVSLRRTQDLKELRDYMKFVYEAELKFLSLQMDSRMFEEHHFIAAYHVEEVYWNSGISRFLRKQILIDKKSDPIYQRFFADILISSGEPTTARLKLFVARDFLLSCTDKEPVPVDIMKDVFFSFLEGLERNTEFLSQVAFIKRKYEAEVQFWDEKLQRTFIRYVLKCHKSEYFIEPRDDGYSQERYFEVPPLGFLYYMFEFLEWEKPDKETQQKIDDAIKWWNKRNCLLEKYDLRAAFCNGSLSFKEYSCFDSFSSRELEWSVFKPIYFENREEFNRRYDEFVDTSFLSDLEYRKMIDSYNKYCPADPVVVGDFDRRGGRIVHLTLPQAAQIAPVYLGIKHQIEFDKLLSSVPFKRGGDFLVFLMRKRFKELDLKVQAKILSLMKDFMGTGKMTSEAEIVKVFMKEDNIIAKKLGQMLSERPDLLGEEYRDTLRELQEDFKALPYDGIATRVSPHLQRAGFTLISIPKPIGSGSIAQAYSARVRLNDGKPVPEGLKIDDNREGTIIIKVRKPEIDGMVVDAEGAPTREMLSWQRLASDLKKIKKRFPGLMDPEGIYAEFFEMLKEEVDFSNEARNCETLRAQNLGVALPHILNREIEPNLDVLLMTEAKGVSPREAYKDNPEKRAEAGRALMRFFLNCVISGKPVHGDWNPGNIRFYCDDSSLKFKMEHLGLIDPAVMFSMTKKSENDLLNPLMELISALLVKDIDELVSAAIAMNVNGSDIDRASLRRDFERILIDISCGKLKGTGTLQRVFAAMDEARIAIDRSYTKFLKAFITVEGIVKDMDPEFNLEAVLFETFRSSLGRLKINLQNLSFGGLEDESYDKEPLADFNKMELAEAMSQNPVISGSSGIEMIKEVLRGSAEGKRLLKMLDSGVVSKFRLLSACNNEEAVWDLLIQEKWIEKVDEEHATVTLTDEKIRKGLNGYLRTPAASVVAELKRVQSQKWTVLKIDDYDVDFDKVVDALNVGVDGFNMIVLKPKMFLQEGVVSFVRQAVALLRDAGEPVIAQRIKKHDVKGLITLWKIQDELSKIGVSLDIESNIEFPVSSMKKHLLKEGEAGLVRIYDSFVPIDRVMQLYDKAEAFVGKFSKSDPLDTEEGDQNIIILALKSLLKMMSDDMTIYQNYKVLQMSKDADFQEIVDDLTSNFLFFENSANRRATLKSAFDAVAALERERFDVPFFAAEGIPLGYVRDRAGEASSSSPISPLHWQTVAGIIGLDGFEMVDLGSNIWETKDKKTWDHWIRVLELLRYFIKHLYEDENLSTVGFSLLKFLPAESPESLLWLYMLYDKSPLFEELIKIMKRCFVKESPQEFRRRVKSLLTSPWIRKNGEAILLLDKMIFYLLSRYHDGRYKGKIKLVEKLMVDQIPVPTVDGDTVYMADPGFYLKDTVHVRSFPRSYANGVVQITKGGGIRASKSVMGWQYSKSKISGNSNTDTAFLQIAFKRGSQGIMGGVSKGQVERDMDMVASLEHAMKNKEGRVKALDRIYGVNDRILLHDVKSHEVERIPITLEIKGDLEDSLDTKFIKNTLLSIRDILADGKIIEIREKDDGVKEYTVLANARKMMDFLELHEEGKEPANVFVETYLLKDPDNRPMSNVRISELMGLLQTKDPYDLFKNLSPFAGYYDYSMKFKGLSEKELLPKDTNNLKDILSFYFEAFDKQGRVVSWEMVLTNIFQGFAASVGSMTDLVHNELRGVLHSGNPNINWSQYSHHNLSLSTCFDVDILVFNSTGFIRDERAIDIKEAKDVIKTVAHLFGLNGQICKRYGYDVFDEYMTARDKPRLG